MHTHDEGYVHEHPWPPGNLPHVHDHSYAPGVLTGDDDLLWDDIEEEDTQWE